jgi:hypothetical protein
VGLANLVPPKASSHRDSGEVDQDDGSWDGSGYLFGTLNSHPDVPIVVPVATNALNLVCWPAWGLLLHRHGLQDLIPGKKSTVSDSLMGSQKR